MKKSQIKELTESIAKYDELSEEDLKWIFSNLSRQELKLFIRLLSKEVKNSNVKVSFAGELSDEHKKKIAVMFPNKRILFKRDDESIAGGLHFEYNDFVLDYSVSGIVKRILNSIKESL
ncbi:MAG: F0F1 ATP synthase subunit delta [Endomicrobium sp.]|jgi:F-type H+-transporting ATPase subunit delta|nr:F0F1 ATP synthase subunit delta [Endomicrobium sp.]